MFVPTSIDSSEFILNRKKVGEDLFYHHYCSCSSTQSIFSSSTMNLSRSHHLVSMQSFDHILASESSSEVLSNRDILDGTLLAIILALLFAFLQGRLSSSNIKLWPENTSTYKMMSISEETIESPDDNLSTQEGIQDEIGEGNNVFDADDWMDISKPENYVMYGTKLKKNRYVFLEEDRQKISKTKKENKVVLVSLLILFLPIFSAEFFFALSRQFICGDFVTKVDDNLWLSDPEKAIALLNGLSPWARELCSPHFEP